MAKASPKDTVPLILVLDIRDQDREVVDERVWSYDWPKPTRDERNGIFTFNGIHVDETGSPLTVTVELPVDVPRGRAILVEQCVVKAPEQVTQLVKDSKGSTVGSRAYKPAAPFELDERWPCRVDTIRNLPPDATAEEREAYEKERSRARR